MSNLLSYLSLLKKSLLNDLYVENEARMIYLAHHIIFNKTSSLKELIKDFIDVNNTSDLLGLIDLLRKTKDQCDYFRILCTDDHGVINEMAAFRNFTFTAHTMIGRARVENLHQCLDVIREENIPGDVIETGVWKGGATIFMRGYLKAYDMNDRKVWVADSFEGLPKPTLPQDQGNDFSKDVFLYLAVDLDTVKDYFQRYDLLDEGVEFLKGWFKDTLPTAPIQSLALLRLDGDLYESTMDSLRSLYDKVSPGGFVIVDDYLGFPGCKEAVDDFRAAREIQSEMISIDDSAIYWRTPRL